MTIEPEGEAIRKATRWISDERLADSAANLAGLVEKACVKFDLPPSDAEFLMRFFTKKNTAEDA
jgi:hypothetical protein